VGIAVEYQEEAAVICIHGGVTTLSSLSAIKHFSREILAAELGSLSGGRTFPLPLMQWIILIAARVWDPYRWWSPQ
jgi:hypothetical protein